MSRAKAIQQYCSECANSPKEVSLCQLIDCPLYPYRFGYSSNDKRYKKRMETAKKNYPKDYQEMLNILSDNLSDKPNSPEIVQIHAFLKKNGLA